MLVDVVFGLISPFVVFYVYSVCLYLTVAF